jgi:hypothetical protein
MSLYNPQTMDFLAYGMHFLANKYPHNFRRLSLSGGR